MSLRTPEQIQKMRKSGEILHKILHETKEMVLPGTNVKEIEKYVDSLFVKYSVKPSFKGYHGFPSSICLSVNDQVVHGIPTSRVLHKGDIIGLDCGVNYQGWHTDSAITVVVGGMNEAEPLVQSLVKVTEKALEEAILLVKDGVHIGDISAKIEEIIIAAGFSVAEDLGGHGVGKTVHEDPYIANVGVPGTGQKLKAGMTIALEPISILGHSSIVVDDNDGWTIYSEDETFSAHFEHTILVTKSGAEVLT